MPAYICQTCGVQQAPAPAPPGNCAICEDERQFVGRAGQRWTTLAEMQGSYRNDVAELEPELFQLTTRPAFGIGQRALLVRTPEGNLLWDCLSYLDPATTAAVTELGGLSAIAISHPHFYATCVEWSEAFGGAPIYLSSRDREFLPRPSPAVVHFDGDEAEPLPGLRVLRLGGHFQGSTVLHWAGGADGGGALLTGDTIAVAADRRWVSFQYSYPNRIPLPTADVRSIAKRIATLSFDRIYGAWPDDVIPVDARAAVLRSTARYLGMLAGNWPRG
jgi:glyoxylase-like metal-dependent hydrolase (beta-lactamase superfamily II)